MVLQTLQVPVTGLLDKFIEDKDQKNALAHEIATFTEKQAHEAALAQVEVNKQEAQDKSIFVAGWRYRLQDGSLRSRLHTTLLLFPLFFSQQRSLVSRFLSYLSLIWKR